MPFGLSGVSSSRSVAISRSKASRATRLSSLSSGIFRFDSVGFVSGVVQCLAAPAQFVAQNIKIVSVAGLYEIESCATLSNHHSIFDFQWKPDLAVEC